MTDLILASFDILASAMYRSETTESTSNLLRSFLVNKLPVFLTNYAAMMFENLTVRNCIQQALSRVDPAAFPPSYSQMFDPLGTTGMLSEARQEFLFACALHQLIEEKDIEGLLGDVPMQSLPASGRYVKSGLVAQCSSNPAKIEEFIAELDNMEGNAGEIVAALLEVSYSGFMGPLNFTFYLRLRWLNMNRESDHQYVMHQQRYDDTEKRVCCFMSKAASFGRDNALYRISHIYEPPVSCSRQLGKP